MNQVSRMAGAGLLVYGIGTTIGFAGAGGPGGDYEPDIVAAYFDPRHYPTAMAFWYVGALSALGLVLFGLGLRRSGGQVGEALWALAVAGTAVSVTGAFVGGGLVVAAAEGGPAVQGGVPQPVVYTISEIANLLTVCAPALFVGAAGDRPRRAGRAPDLAEGLLGHRGGLRDPRADLLHPRGLPDLGTRLRHLGRGAWRPPDSSSPLAADPSRTSDGLLRAGDTRARRRAGLLGDSSARPVGMKGDTRTSSTRKDCSPGLTRGSGFDAKITRTGTRRGGRHVGAPNCNPPWGPRTKCPPATTSFWSRVTQWRPSEIRWSERP